MIRICRKWWLLKIRTFLANTFFRHPRNCAPFWLAYSGCFFRKSTFYGSSPKIQQFSPSILNTKIAIISNKLSKIIIIFKCRILEFCSFWTSEASRTTPKRSELPLPLLQKIEMQIKKSLKKVLLAGTPLLWVVALAVFTEHRKAVAPRSRTSVISAHKTVLSAGNTSITQLASLTPQKNKNMQISQIPPFSPHKPGKYLITQSGLPHHLYSHKPGEIKREIL